MIYDYMQRLIIMLIVACFELPVLQYYIIERQIDIKIRVNDPT